MNHVSLLINIQTAIWEQSWKAGNCENVTQGKAMLKTIQKVDLKTFALPYRGQNPGAVKLTRQDLDSVHRGIYA